MGIFIRNSLSLAHEIGYCYSQQIGFFFKKIDFYFHFNKVYLQNKGSCEQVQLARLFAIHLKNEVLYFCFRFSLVLV